MILLQKPPKDLSLDGGYYSPEIQKEAEGFNLHYTNMTGRKVSSDKLPYSAFKIENQHKVLSCPEGHLPERADFNEKTKTLSAHPESVIEEMRKG